MWPGLERFNDARVFATSSQFHRGRAGSLFPEAKAQTVDDVCVLSGISADAANPLLPWVMKHSQIMAAPPRKVSFQV